MCFFHAAAVVSCPEPCGTAAALCVSAVAFDDGEKTNTQLYTERYLFLPLEDSSE
jgi:hypothetical protein